MSPRPLKNITVSVKQRLLNLARERGEDFNFLLTRYVIERLLYRISESEHSHDFVLKGAMLFHLGSSGLPHRPTRDIDLSGKGPPDIVKEEDIFRHICATAVEDDGVIFVKESIQAERIRDEELQEGIRLHIDARMGSARLPVQVDVGFNDAITPAPKLKRLATLLDHPAPRLLVCPWDTVIAEKFQVLVDLGIANSRMKDYFDLRYLATTLSLDGVTLTRAIKATFARRQTPLPPATPMGLSQAFAQDQGKQTQWRAFARRLKLSAGEDSLGEVMEKLRSFLMPPVEALIQKRPFKMKWPPGGPWSAS